jgi:hypothetical protein
VLADFSLNHVKEGLVTAHGQGRRWEVEKVRRWEVERSKVKGERKVLRTED